mmetsp:Transcript_18314/g.17443  ORF Transcript_18314/g.17443 Transcript_18314/m.17443 type:complete len:84 (+) Transcript_18314:268-519(+)
MKSKYIEAFQKIDSNQKTKIFNLDNERLKLKVPYKVKRDFVSTHQAEYKPYKVVNQHQIKQQDFNPEMNNPCFIGATTYNKTY